MRKFIPSDDFNRVSFASAGVDSLIVVDKAGLTVETEDAEGEPMNVALLSALESHEHLTEVSAAATKVKQPVEVVAPDPDSTPAE